MAGERKATIDPYRDGDVSGALHDVSNALTVLLGWVAEAREAGASSEELEHALAMIEQRARVARDLARRAIGSRGEGAPHVDESLDAVVRDVLTALAVEAQRARVRLVPPRAAVLVSVPAPADLSHILTNLLMNALAHAPRGSAVSLEVTVSERVVTVHVQDAGPGIDPARAESIFQGDSRRDGGAGVGLRHARAVARAAGGDLTLVELADPAHAGSGALFRLVWPRGERGISIMPVSSSRIPILAGTRILVLEDDPDVAALLETALGARGAEVTLATNAKDLARASTSPHDAALIDLSPIKDDVKGAIDRLRAGSPGVKVVFISGSAVGVPDAISAAHVRWVRKPFEISEVVAALTEPTPKQ